MLERPEIACCAEGAKGFPLGEVLAASPLREGQGPPLPLH